MNNNSHNSIKKKSTCITRVKRGSLSTVKLPDRIGIL